MKLRIGLGFYEHGIGSIHLYYWILKIVLWDALQSVITKHFKAELNTHKKYMQESCPACQVIFISIYPVLRFT